MSKGRPEQGQTSPTWARSALAILWQVLEQGLPLLKALSKGRPYFWNL